MTSIGFPGLRRPTLHVCTALAITAIALSAPLVLSGCVGWGTYPRSGDALSPAAVNSSAGEEIIVAAIDWALVRDGVADPVVVSLPEVVKPYRARRIASKVGTRMRNATPQTGPGETVYHVGRVAIRGDEAEIDIYRPVFEAGGDGTAVYQAITINMRGGIQPWSVERTRPWTLGAFTPPAIHPVIDD